MENNEKIINKIAKLHPALKQGVVQCIECDQLLKVNPTKCLTEGWPKCCGFTMLLIKGEGDAY